MSDEADQSVRARFEALTREHLLDAPPLPGGVRVTAPPHEAWAQAHKALGDETWPASLLDHARVFDADERTRHAELDALLSRDARPLTHRLLLVEGEGDAQRVVGCYLGVQEAQARYYMISTVLRPEVRGRGLYTALLAAVLRVARETGFREVFSRHAADNGAVLVPKLKAGFVITGFESTASFGLLVHLRLAFSANLRGVMAWRIDAEAHDAALRARGVLRAR